MYSLYDQILNVKRASGKNGKAPHKTILLLAILDLFESGYLKENKIKISPELIGVFHELWSVYVTESGWKASFFLPFYHLKNDGFWKIKVNDGAQIAITNSYSPKSLSSLTDAIQYAYLDKKFCIAFNDEKKREKLRNFIIQRFFRGLNHDAQKIKLGKSEYLRQLKIDFELGRVADSEVKYELKLNKEARCVFFKNRVPEIYNHTCVISRARLISNSDVQMVDACHIKPWSQSQDDSIQNGITLTPSLHRAFDRNLISIDENYRVLVSNAINEDLKSSFNLKQFEGKQILLPSNKGFYPAQEYLWVHRKNLLS